MIAYSLKENQNLVLKAMPVVQTKEENFSNISYNSYFLLIK